MASLQRVAVTGLGAICGLGHNVEEVWKKAVNGESGISKIENFDTEKLAVKIAGEVKNFTISEDLISAKEAPRYDKFIHYALHSSQEAMVDAGLVGSDHYAPERMGSILGVGMGGFPEIEKTHETFLAKGARRVGPFFIPGIIGNMTTGLISLHFGLKGSNYSTCSACASAAHAIGNAAQSIMLGHQDVIITGGAEAVVSNLPIAGFSSMKAVTKTFNDEPEKSSRPFDTGRNGFVMGEGAGILVLENYDKAVARGAKIYAELVGYGASSDAHHITAPEPEGRGGAQCMQMALDVAELSYDKVDYINAHGTSTPLGDIAETKAVKQIFKEHAKDLVISSTKSMTGHLLGAAGGIEALFCVKALEEGTIPPTINLEDQDPECDLFYAPNKAVKRDIKYALSNSFGFGGTNATTLFKKA